MVDGVKYYPDQSEHQDQVDTLGVQGSLQQSLAIVPTQSGRITLPEVRIPWWNVETDSLQYARLPAQTIMVKAAAQTTEIKSSQVPAAVNQLPTEIVVSNKSNGYWVLVSLVLMLTNMITAFLLWKKKATQQANAIPATTHTNAAAFKIGRAHV